MKKLIFASIVSLLFFGLLALIWKIRHDQFWKDFGELSIPAEVSNEAFYKRAGLLSHYQAIEFLNEDLKFTCDAIPDKLKNLLATESPYPLEKTIDLPYEPLPGFAYNFRQTRYRSTAIGEAAFCLGQKDPQALIHAWDWIGIDASILLHSYNGVLEFVIASGMFRKLFEATEKLLPNLSLTPEQRATLLKKIETTEAIYPKWEDVATTEQNFVLKILGDYERKYPFVLGVLALKIGWPTDAYREFLTRPVFDGKELKNIHPMAGMTMADFPRNRDIHQRFMDRLMALKNHLER